MIDIKKDINFRYIFGKDSEPNKIALTGLIEAFTEEKVDNLKILSTELSINMENAKETRLDILASFGTGEKIDVEMQMYNNKYELI
ncbi:MAG: PD-(D/E)XK nuclease family transposase, partial [Floccifex sp.]